jgi:hypothetical protein
MVAYPAAGMHTVPDRPLHQGDVQHKCRLSLTAPNLAAAALRTMCWQPAAMATMIIIATHVSAVRR